MLNIPTLTLYFNKAGLTGHTNKLQLKSYISTLQAQNNASSISSKLHTLQNTQQLGNRTQ